MTLEYTHRVTSLMGNTVAATFTGAGTNYIVEIPVGDLYLVYVDSNSDVVFSKSTNGGISWSNPTVVFTGTTTALAVWYDRDSGIAAGLIHCAYTESVTDDTLYRTINTESSDALSTQTTIFAGGTTAANGQLTIARARGGNVSCRTCIDNGAEGGFAVLVNANVPDGAWAARTINEALAGSDQMILVPGWAVDTNDMMAFFWDAGSDEISRQLYDDSADSWGETSIATSMVETAASGSFPHFAAAVDIANSRNLLVAWSAVDTLNADLRCWHVTESAITELTNVVQNSTDDQGLCGISINTVTNAWTVVYAGKSDGSETWNTTVNIYTKTSLDSGSTWGSETKISNYSMLLNWLITCPRRTGPFIAASYIFPIAFYTERSTPRATAALGMS